MLEGWGEGHSSTKPADQHPIVQRSNTESTVIIIGIFAQHRFDEYDGSRKNQIRGRQDEEIHDRFCCNCSRIFGSTRRSYFLLDHSGRRCPAYYGECRRAGRLEKHLCYR